MEHAGACGGVGIEAGWTVNMGLHAGFFVAKGCFRGMRESHVVIRTHRTVATCAPSRRAGFSLIEVLIVVLILAILAALAIPRFSRIVGMVEGTVAEVSTNRLQQGIDRYAADHGGSYPSLANFNEQMTMASNAAGDTAPPGTPGYPYGPYFKELPLNPASRGNTIGGGGVGTSDWRYDPGSGLVVPNSSEAVLNDVTRRHMAQLLQATLRYARRNSGAFPARLQDLEGTEMGSVQFRRAMTNPRTGDSNGFNYTPPSEPLDVIEHPESVAMMHENTGGGEQVGLIGFADGHLLQK